MSPGRRCTSTAGWPCSDGRARSGVAPPPVAAGRHRAAAAGLRGAPGDPGPGSGVRTVPSGENRRAGPCRGDSPGERPGRPPGLHGPALRALGRQRPPFPPRAGPLQISPIPLPQPASKKGGRSGCRVRRRRSGRIGRADRIRLASRRSAAATSACCPGGRRAKRSAKRETRLSMPWKLRPDCGGIAAPARRNSAGFPAVRAPVALGPRCCLSARPRAAGESVCHASNLCYDPAEPAGRPGRSARERPFRAWAWGGGRPQAPRRGKDRRAAAPKRCEEDR
ncbi:hypothetical protein ruthe_00637 [Rubellimicrobium thermophilum DSM 16684]|uniref:Uncharacterized protein n=1 Tax=Rubellimicrobium thermophilum DSM 16684 TaxID=1123069 RepID=S9SLH0_9RHOB|nr:hypothetical protein ruthe_00637 [Rubellimicrobium thermophilum DSM 16684]